MKAVGRALVPRGHAPGAEYVLDGEFLLCLVCQRWMWPAPRADGTRAYWCGPPCRQHDLLAATLESRLELSALTRAVTALHPDLASARCQDDAPVAGSSAEAAREPARPDPEELRRWRTCDLSARRAVIHTAYVRAEIDASGEVHSVPHPATRQGS